MVGIGGDDKKKKKGKRSYTKQDPNRGKTRAIIRTRASNEKGTGKAKGPSVGHIVFLTLRKKKGFLEFGGKKGFAYSMRESMALNRGLHTKGGDWQRGASTF